MASPVHDGRRRLLAVVGLVVVAATPATAASAAERRARDADRDRLTNRWEVRRSHTNPRRADTDRDRLRDRFELRRSKTNPRVKDTDRDGLADGFEVRRSATNPRVKDTDGDGAEDGVEVLLGTNARKAPKGKPRSPIDTTAPQTTILAGPSGTVQSASASFSFESSEPGSSFECRLDAGPWGGCSSPWTYSGLANGAHAFSVRATDPANDTDSSPASRTWTVDVELAPPPPPPPPPPPEGDGPSCRSGAANASTAAQVRSAVSAGQDVCVTADVGNVNLSSLKPASVVHVGTPATSGSMGAVELANSARITLSARLRSTTIRGSNTITIDRSILGGTPTKRVLDQLIFMPDTNSDVKITNNDLGWTDADSSGNTGYGCRCYGNNTRLLFQGNYIHHIAGDGFQGVGGSDVTIDRNQFAYVGASPGSNEHSDNIQITGHGPNLRITNNWVHHQGWYSETQQSGNAGAMYVHGGDTDPMTVENNLFSDSRGRVEFAGLGTGGTTKSNLTVRRNTFANLGTAFTGFPGFEWDVDSGTGNLVERNVATDPDGGFGMSGSPSSAAFLDNVFGKSVPLDTDGGCASAACNPADQEPIGYRKPAGVRW
jgi:hypothetical protein